MKIEFERGVLSEGLAIVSLVGKSEGLIRVRDGAVTLVAQDAGVMTLSASVLARSEQANAEIVLDFGKLKGVADIAKSEPIKIDFQDSSSFLTFSKSKYRFALGDPRGFPGDDESRFTSLVSLGEPTQFAADLLIAAGMTTAGSMVTDGVYIRSEGESTIMVATDRLQIIELTTPGASVSQPIIIAPKVAQIINKLIGKRDNSEDAFIAVDDEARNVHLRTQGGLAMTAATFSGTYPDYRPIIAANIYANPMVRISGLAKDLGLMFKRALLSDMENFRVAVTTDGTNAIRLTRGVGEIKDFDESVDFGATIKGEITQPFSQEYNVKHLIGALATLDEDVVAVMDFAGEGRPVRITSPASPGMIYVTSAYRPLAA